MITPFRYARHPEPGRWAARLATLAAVALACRAEPPATPSSEPLADFPYAAASLDCAPWDGPAVGIVLTRTADTAQVPAAPYVRVMLYNSPNRLAGQTIGWPGDAEVGSATWCVVGDDCVVADSGLVQIETVIGDSVLPGRLRLAFPGGARLDGSFRATWRPRVALCG